MTTTLPKKGKPLWYGIERALMIECQRYYDTANEGRQLYVLIANVADGRSPVNTSDVDKAILSLVLSS